MVSGVDVPGPAFHIKVIHKVLWSLITRSLHYSMLQINPACSYHFA